MKHLDVSKKVKKALKDGRPVIALESTIISHGMPYPQNVETALNCERIARENGAEPATIAIIGGKLCAGLEEEQIEYLGKTGLGIQKASRRDLPAIVARRQDGATTVAATMIIAAMAGIKVFAPAVSAGFTAALRPPWISQPTWKNWLTPPSPSSARAPKAYLTSASPLNTSKPAAYR